MVFLINSIPFLIVALGGLFVYFTPRWRNKMIAIIATIFISLIYTQVQPSYMPKGTVRSTPTVEFQKLDIPMVDRSLKTKSDAERDIERKAAMKEIDDNLQKQIEKNKE